MLSGTVGSPATNRNAASTAAANAFRSSAVCKYGSPSSRTESLGFTVPSNAATNV